MYDAITSIFLGILYNMFFHKFADFYYKDLSYDNRYKSTVLMLLIAGILGAVIGKIYIEKNFEKKISNGIILGGFLLVGSALLNNWAHMSEITKIVLIVLTMGYVIYYSSDKHKITSHKNNKN